MCEATTIAYVTLALTAAGSAAQYETQRSAANTQADASRENAALSAMDRSRQAAQQQEALAGQLNEHARQAREDAALFDVITGEYGGGRTADRAAAIGNIQANEALATIKSNGEKALTETAFAGSAADTRLKNQLASISRPSLLGTSLTIAGAATKTYGDSTPKKTSSSPQ